MAKVELYRSRYTGTDVDNALGKIVSFNTDKFKETINSADDVSSKMNAALSNPPDFFIDNNGHLIFHYDEYFEIKLAPGVWDEFTTALIEQWSGTTAQLSRKTAIQDLLKEKEKQGISEENYFNNILCLRISGDGLGGYIREFTADEFLNMSINPLRTALFNSNRGKNKDFFNATGATMKLAPTWEEFQYLLLYYSKIYNNYNMPTTEECSEYNTQKNYPWKWRKIYGEG